MGNTSSSNKSTPLKQTITKVENTTPNAITQIFKTATEKQQTHVKQGFVFSFQSDGSGWTRQDVSAETSECSLEKLEIITYNVWFDQQWKEQRENALFEVLKQHKAHVICLQEVTKGLLERLQDNAWIQQNYWLSDIDGSSWDAWYGVVILSTLPCCHIGYLTNMKSSQGRRFLYADFKIPNPIRIGTIHLESKTSVDTRAHQLNTIIPFLQESSQLAIFCGDMNLHDAWEENEKNFGNRKDFYDVWSNLYPNDPGFSENTEINSMLKYKEGGKKKQVRYDRIFLIDKHPRKLKPVDIQLLGTQKIDTADLSEIFISDHFGLSGSFQVVTTLSSSN